MYATSKPAGRRAQRYHTPPKASSLISALRLTGTIVSQGPSVYRKYRNLPSGLEYHRVVVVISPGGLIDCA